MKPVIFVMKIIVLIFVNFHRQVFCENFCPNHQRWSRGHKARGQGQEHKKIRGQGQGQPFRGQNLSMPRTGMLVAKAKDQGHKRKCSPKKKKKKVFTKIFQAISTKKRFSSAPLNFNNSKNSAVLEPRTGQFLRTWGLEAKAKDLTFEAKAKDFKICTRGQRRPRGLHLCQSFYAWKHTWGPALILVFSFFCKVLFALESFCWNDNLRDKKQTFRVLWLKEMPKLFQLCEQPLLRSGIISVKCIVTLYTW